MTTKARTPHLISGRFARVFSGNCTASWMVEGDDLQARANAALGACYESDAPLYERNVEGYAVAYGDDPYVALFASREFAEQALARQIAYDARQ